MWQQMAVKEKPIPEDSGIVIVEPDLSLSVKEIMDRWVRNQPLDVIQRNGTFLVEGNDFDDDVYNVEDTDLMDITEANDYLEQKASVISKHQNRSAKKERVHGDEVSEADSEEPQRATE